MKVFFINVAKNLEQNNGVLHAHPYHVLPPLDIGYCAALLEREGHKILFIDTALEPQDISGLTQEIVKVDTDIAVLKPDILTYRITLELARQLKKYVRHVIVIGPVVSSSPEFFIFEKSPIDACVMGEPEYTLLEVVTRIERLQRLTGISGLCYFDQKAIIAPARQPCPDLDALPFPKHGLFLNKGYSFLYPIRINKRIKFEAMLTSRGCPYSCTFCSPIRRVSYGREYRIRSAQNVVDEIEFLALHGINMIYFLDDLFNYDYNRVISICDAIQKRKLDITWAAQIRADIKDQAILSKMRDAGCGCINLGIESADDTVLKRIDKKITIKDIERTVSLCRKIGICAVGSFIIGLPGQTREIVAKSLKFAQRLQLDLVEVLLFTPYPGSRAFEVYGRREREDTYSHYDNVVDSYCEMGIDELRKTQIQFYRDYYFNVRFMFDFLLHNKYWIIKNLMFNPTFLKKAFLFLMQTQ
jgi:radical SAM superfamily enzyme YgiQ (UPF0313 family)